MTNYAQSGGDLQSTTLFPRVIINTTRKLTSFERLAEDLLSSAEFHGRRQRDAKHDTLRMVGSVLSTTDMTRSLTSFVQLVPSTGYKVVQQAARELARVNLNKFISDQSDKLGPQNEVAGRRSLSPRAIEFHSSQRSTLGWPGFGVDTDRV